MSKYLTVTKSCQSFINVQCKKVEKSSTNIGKCKNSYTQGRLFERVELWQCTWYFDASLGMACDTGKVLGSTSKVCIPEDTGRTRDAIALSIPGPRRLGLQMER